MISLIIILFGKEYILGDEPLDVLGTRRSGERARIMIETERDCDELLQLN